MGYRVSMYVRTYVCAYIVCTFVTYSCACMCAYVGMFAYVCLGEFVHACVCVCMRACMSVSMSYS